MTEKFKPWFPEKTKKEFGPYVEKDINTLVLVLEKDEEFEFEEEELDDLKADLFENCFEEEDIIGVAFTFLIENGIDDPEEFLKEKGILE